MKKIPCPNCLGVKQIMTPRKKRGFQYEDCNYCDDNGLVTEEQEENFILSMNENLLIEET